jgi:alkenylglycerophosphocholine hydrolase
MLKFIKDRFYIFSRTDIILYLIFFIFSIAYLTTLELRPYPFHYAIKAIPILCLSLIAIKSVPGSIGKFIFTGTVFSAVGDVFLSLSGNHFFIFGLSSFGLAHLMYVIALFKEPKIQKPGIYFASAVVLYSIVIWSILGPNLGGMTVPVTIYLFLIMLMGLSSILGKNNHPLIIVGAFLFIISDSLIAINMFLTKIPNSSFWIMFTYYPAQLLIVYGAYRSKK